jgi:hypothetical protein
VFWRGVVRIPNLMFGDACDCFPLCVVFMLILLSGPVSLPCCCLEGKG